MPIRPENKLRYPRDWKQISLAIRERAGQRCECRGECGLDHTKEPVPMQWPEDRGRCAAMNYQPHPNTGSKVILTVAHLDHTPENCDPANLKAMCQRCHNRYDMPKRREGIRERARQAADTVDLFEEKQ